MDTRLEDIAATQAEQAVLFTRILERLDEQTTLLKTIETMLQSLLATYQGEQRKGDDTDNSTST